MRQDCHDPDRDRRSLRGDLTEVIYRDLADYDRAFGVHNLNHPTEVA